MFGYGGQLDIRPPYQREFIYKDKQRDAVIETVSKDFPLNVMYWAVRDEGGYEVIDGQQRTISICQYVEGGLLVQGSLLPQPPRRQEEAIPRLRTDGLSAAAARTARSWSGSRPSTSRARSSPIRSCATPCIPARGCQTRSDISARPGAPLTASASDYMSGPPIRQEYLETAINGSSDDDVEDYMGKHQHDANAEPCGTTFRMSSTG